MQEFLTCLNFCLFVFGHYDSIKVHPTGTRLMNCPFGEDKYIPVYNGTVDLLSRWLLHHQCIEIAVNELSPRSTQSIERATMSPMINALTNATVASVHVIATVENDTEVTVPRRTTRSQSTRLNLAATFEVFVPANNPNAWRDRDLE